MATSRRELLRDQLVRAFGQISTDNGYRTDPLPVVKTLLLPGQAVEFPTICVSIGDEYLSFPEGDMPRANLLTTYVNVEVRGYFGGDTTGVGEDLYAAENYGEPLLHDMKQVFAGFLTTNINHSTEGWLVSNVRDPKFFGPRPAARNSGMVSIQFVVKFIRQSATFS